MAKPTTEAPEEFFRILEQLDSIPATAAEEIEDRLNLARIVPTAVERQAVRMTTDLIAAEMKKVDNGADPGELAAKLVGIVSEKNGPTPFLGRIQAVVALGKMRAKNRFIIEPSSPLGRELIEGMATEPTFGGSLILQGAHEGTVKKNGGQLSQRDEAVSEEITDIKDRQQLEEWVDKQKRHAMMDAARELFSTEVDLENMLLPEWQLAQGKMKYGPGEHPEGHAVPKYVMRLSALGVNKKGQDELRCHICSPEMQLVAAAWGMPAQDSFASGKLIDRNPTAVLTANRLALDEVKGASALKRTGLLIDAFYVMPESQRKSLEKEMNGVGLVYKTACKQLPADGLTFIAASRVSRRLNNNSSRVRVNAARVIDSVVKELRQEVEIVHTRGGQVVSTEKTSIMKSYLDQFNMTRGKLEGRTATMAQAEESLVTAVTAAICSVPGGDFPPVRVQSDLVRMMPEVVRRGVAPEDLKLYPRLATSDRVCIETIYRVSTPQSAIPPVTIRRKQD